MSPLRRSGGFSTSATGFEGRPKALRARWKMPCVVTMILRREAGVPGSVALQASTIAGVTSSMRMSPKAGLTWPSMSQR
jgi:hypothetical protein